MGNLRKTDPKKIAERIKDLYDVFYVAVSGGKDSTATALWALEHFPKEKLFFAFADTGHEATETYKYINYLEETLDIEIHRYKPKRNFYELVEHKGFFPSKNSRFCTDELKKSVRNLALTDLINRGYERICIITGIRADESEERSKYPIYERQKRTTTGVFRPIFNWSVEDVFEYIRSKGIKVNPLYEKGVDRVGCFPCIFASPEEIRLLYEDEDFKNQKTKIEYVEKKIARPFFIDETIRQRYERIKTGKYRRRKKKEVNHCNVSGILMCE